MNGSPRATDGGRSEIRTRPMWPLAFVGALWIGTALVVMGIGAVHIDPGQILRMLGQRVGLSALEADWPLSHETILFQLRLPRVVLGGLVGAALSVAGATLQGLFRNPMAGPYTLGVSSGAALGAVIAIVYGVPAMGLGFSTVPFVAFLAAVVTVAIVYTVARSVLGVSTLALLLAGVAISSFLSALVSFILVFDEERIGAVLFWIMGGLGQGSWNNIAGVLPFFAVGIGVAWWYARDLNALLMGEEAAYHFGVDVEGVKRRLLIAASLMTAAAVSVSGVIGFVGMIVPHMVRHIFGPDHRALIPLAAMGGGIFLMIADTVARTVVAPGEIPVGVMTALCGAPFFLWILRKTRGRSG